MSTTQNGFWRAERIIFRRLCPSRTFLQAMVPSELYCELQTIPNLLCLLRSSINFFVVPLGHLNFIVRIHHRTVHKHTFCPHLRAIKRPNCSGCVGFLYPKGWSRMGHPCSFRCYPVDRLPPKKKKSHRILMGICTGRGTKLLVY